MPDGAQNSAVVADHGMIFQKMPLILAEIGAIKKEKSNAQQGFKYRGIDDCYAALQPLLAKHHVFMSALILEKSREERTTKSGGVLAFTSLRMRYRFYAEDGSFVDTEAEGEGMDSGDKSSNKAMAVAHKYAILQAFCIPTEDADDPDRESHEIAERPPEVDPKEVWANNAIAWLDKQTDLIEVQKFWKDEAGKIKQLEPYQFKPLEKAKEAAKVRITEASRRTPAINLDDEIPF